MNIRDNLGKAANDSRRLFNENPVSVSDPYFGKSVPLHPSGQDMCEQMLRNQMVIMDALIEVINMAKRA